MNELTALHRLLLSIVLAVPAIALAVALVTFLGYWFFIGRHASQPRIMQDISVGIRLKNRRRDAEPQTTTTEDAAQ